jgi:hypothetical protein
LLGLLRASLDVFRGSGVAKGKVAVAVNNFCVLC